MHTRSIRSYTGDSTSHSVGSVAVKKIARAIERSTYTWRKPSTLAEETGLTLELVRKALNSSERFVQADHPADDGQPLFSTAQKLKRRTSSLGARVLNALANKVIE